MDHFWTGSIGACETGANCTKPGLVIPESFAPAIFFWSFFASSLIPSTILRDLPLISTKNYNCNNNFYKCLWVHVNYRQNIFIFWRQEAELCTMTTSTFPSTDYGSIITDAALAPIFDSGQPCLYHSHPHFQYHAIVNNKLQKELALDFCFEQTFNFIKVCPETRWCPHCSCHFCCGII